MSGTYEQLKQRACIERIDRLEVELQEANLEITGLKAKEAELIKAKAEVKQAQAELVEADSEIAGLRRHRDQLVKDTTELKAAKVAQKCKCGHSGATHFWQPAPDTSCDLTDCGCLAYEPKDGVLDLLVRLREAWQAEHAEVDRLRQALYEARRKGRE